MTSPTDGPTSDRPDICIVLNPKSGKRGRDARDRIERAAARHPGRFEIRPVGRGRDVGAVADRAAVDGFATLAAAGGDGTIGAVAAAALRHDRRLGILSMGTFNFVARGLRLPEDLDDAVALLAEGDARPMDVAEVNGRVFLNNASLGLYPAILARREGIYGRWGRSRLAAHWSVLSTFARFHRPLSLRVTVDGRTLEAETPLAFVARSAFQLDHFGLEGADDVRSGRFALFLAPDVSRAGLLVFALRLAGHAMQRDRDFLYHSGREIVIETRSPQRVVARDGERERMDSPFRFRILSGALHVIAPPEATP